ncbi:MAG: alpha/beta fold hydrolase [Clostridia bacterium]
MTGTKTLALSNQRTIAYKDEGKGVPLVLLHGFCGSHAYWDMVLPELAKQYRVLVPDLPGHGQSSIPEDMETIEQMADWLHEMLNALAVTQATLIGHSLGGYITLAFAERYGELLKRFGLVHSTSLPDSADAMKARDASSEKVKAEGIHALIDGLVPKLFAPANLERMEQEVQRTKEIGYATSPKGAIAVLQAMKNRPDRTDVLSSTSLPVLLVAGEHDQVIPKEKTFTVTRDTVSHAVLNTAGHMGMLESPAQLVEVLRGFAGESEA